MWSVNARCGPRNAWQRARQQPQPHAVRRHVAPARFGGRRCASGRDSAAVDRAAPARSGQGTHRKGVWSHDRLMAASALPVSSARQARESPTLATHSVAPRTKHVIAVVPLKLSSTLLACSARFASWNAAACADSSANASVGWLSSAAGTCARHGQHTRAHAPLAAHGSPWPPRLDGRAWRFDAQRHAARGMRRTARRSERGAAGALSCGANPEAEAGARSRRCGALSGPARHRSRSSRTFSAANCAHCVPFSPWPSKTPKKWSPAAPPNAGSTLYAS